jgi:hypothetical protein
MSVLKVETDINTNIEYVKTFKSDIIVFICYVIMCWTSHWLIFFDISQFVDTNTITHQTKSAEITDGFIYYADIEMSAFFISFLLQSLKLFILKKRNSIVNVILS